MASPSHRWSGTDRDKLTKIVLSGGWSMCTPYVKHPLWRRLTLEYMHSCPQTSDYTVSNGLEPASFYVGVLSSSMGEILPPQKVVFIFRISRQSVPEQEVYYNFAEMTAVARDNRRRNTRHINGVYDRPATESALQPCPLGNAVPTFRRRSNIIYFATREHKCYRKKWLTASRRMCHTE